MKVFAPVRQTGTQLCENIEASDPFDLLQDDLGNQLLLFKFETIPPRAVKTILITADLKLSEIPNPFPSGSPENFLAPEKTIESDSPEIINAAKRLAGANRLETAANIFDFVSGHVRYDGFYGSMRGASWALKHGKGDCSEHMCLFVALCRAAGIPARGVGGYVRGADGLLNPFDYHNWAEFHADGAWNPADPQAKRFLQSRNYIAMRVIDEFAGEKTNRFHLFAAIGESMEAKMKVWN